MDGNILQPSNRKLLEELIEETATVALLFGSLSKYPFLVMHYVKELKLPREGLHGMRSESNVENKGYFDFLGELLWKICTGSLGEKSDEF